MVAAHTTIASATSIPATSAGFHGIAGQLPVPPASTFASQASSTHSYQQQQQQQTSVDPTLERLLMMGDAQAPNNSRSPDAAPSDMFAPMGFGSD
ncbi:hypothetical protein LPJ75_005170, partial [Coemansia sp. RSA 2598]